MGKFISKKIQMKSVARLAAVQATYMIDFGGLPVDEVVKDFVEGKVGRYVIDEDLEHDIEEPVELSELDAEYFSSLVKGIHKNKEVIEKSLNQYLEKDFKFEKFDATLQALLLSAVYEIIHNTDVDVKVIIKEYVDLAYAFFNKKEPKMVNALLDKVAKSIR